jgi:Arc/MetJ-type ribon-helix-helix transcriptional regulator
VGRKQTLVQLSDEQVAALDAVARRRHLSRSALIREAIDALLADDREAEIGRAIVEGYTRIPPGTPDEWGDLEAQLDRNTTELLQRLDEEERQAGAETWW